MQVQKGSEIDIIPRSPSRKGLLSHFKPHPIQCDQFSVTIAVLTPRSSFMQHFVQNTKTLWIALHVQASVHFGMIKSIQIWAAEWLIWTFICDLSPLWKLSMAVSYLMVFPFSSNSTTLYFGSWRIVFSSLGGCGFFSSLTACFSKAWKSKQYEKLSQNKYKGLQNGKTVVCYQIKVCIRSLQFLQDTIIVPTRHYFCSYKTLLLFLKDTITVATITSVLQPDLYTIQWKLKKKKNHEYSTSHCMKKGERVKGDCAIGRQRNSISHYAIIPSFSGYIK